jgi:hypothetical protein
MRKRHDFYVYTHSDSQGTVFYVGKGAGRRAWSKERDEVWHRYVSERLKGEYDIKIIQSGLTEDEAFDLENALMREHKAETLLNLQTPLPKITVTLDNAGNATIIESSFAEKVDWEEIDHYHDVRRADESFVAATKALEKTDLETAVVRYKTAVIRMRELEKMSERLFRPPGLRGELFRFTRRGQPRLLDRLTLCLTKLGRLAEAAQETERYLAEFPDARESSIGKAIIKRIDRIKNDG